MRTWMLVTTAIGCGATPAFDPDSDGVVSIGSFFGKCDDRCISTVSFRDDGAVDVDISTWHGRPYAEPSAFTQPGHLAPAGADELERIEWGLAAAELQRTWGCPDCTDGGGMKLVWTVGGVTTTHQWPYGRPPAAVPELADLGRLFRSLVAALEDCRETTDVVPDASCAPVPPL